MSTQPTLFDQQAVAMQKPAPRCSEETGRQLKERGMQKAAAKHAQSLADAQWTARYLVRMLGQITIEDVRRNFEKVSRPWDLGNAAGSVFKGPEWECVGYREATRPEAHARILRVWRLK